jgi:enoyl-CoA hydratase/carnithine racemase
MSFVTFEQQGSIAIVTLNRPDRLNAISDALIADFQSALDRAEQLSEVRSIVVCGAGRAFCAGEDLKELGEATKSDAVLHDHVTALQSITRTMRHSSKVYIAAAHGYAVGGGFEWMVSADLVVAADDLVVFLPEIDRALFPTGGVSWLLPMTIGYHRTMELLLLAKRQSAQRLLEMGLVNCVVPKDKLMERATEIARSVADKSEFSVAQLKRLLNQDLPFLERALEFEQKYTIQAFKHPDAARKAADFASRKSAT